MSAAPSRKPGLPADGEVIAGKYKVTALIGEGGMGAVFKAHHELLRHDVAVKLLLPQVAANPDAVTRFLAEARAVARLRSQHVAQVMDVGELDNGSAYMALELLEGKDLSTVLDERGPLPVEEAVDYALQALEGVAHAHALGIVHRDLKPANLFLTRVMGGEPMIKVLDFGISKAVTPGSGPSAAVTQTNALLGSPAFMSPEQVRSSKRVDHRTDIWSLGVILYRLLSGKAPFGGENIGAMFAAILEETPELLSTARPEVPEGLAKVVARCLERNREARWQTVSELADALVPYTYPAGSVTADRIRRTLGASEAPGSKVAWLSVDARSSIPSKKGASLRARALSYVPETERLSTVSGPADAGRLAGVSAEVSAKVNGLGQVSVTVGSQGALSPKEILGKTTASGAAEASGPSERTGERTSSPWVETTASGVRGRMWLFAVAAVALVGLGVLSVVVMRGGGSRGTASRGTAAASPGAADPRGVRADPPVSAATTAAAPAVSVTAAPVATTTAVAATTTVGPSAAAATPATKATKETAPPAAHTPPAPSTASAAPTDTEIPQSRF